MRINYNVTGAQRKELVKVISDTTGAKAEYKFMPTCDYSGVAEPPNPIK